MARRSDPLQTDEAEVIALQALQYLAQDGDRLGRFLSLTGIGPQDLRTGAGDTAVLTAVLGYMAEDESLLLVFCDAARLPPESVMDAHRALRASQGDTAADH